MKNILLGLIILQVGFIAGMAYQKTIQQVDINQAIKSGGLTIDSNKLICNPTIACCVK